ncbi:PTS sugar transporter subunit IIA [Furfurilactobacillus cerevisiae]
MSLSPSASSLDTFQTMAQRLVQLQRVSDVDAFTDLIVKREAQGMTMIAPQILMPHAVGSVVLRNTVLIGWLQTPQHWRQLPTIRLIVMLATPTASAAQTDPQFTTLLTRLADDEVTKKLVKQNSLIDVRALLQ